MVAIRIAIPTGTLLLASIPTSTASEDPGSRVAEVKDEINSVRRMVNMAVHQLEYGTCG